MPFLQYLCKDNKLNDLITVFKHFTIIIVKCLKTVNIPPIFFFFFCTTMMQQGPQLGFISQITVIWGEDIRLLYSAGYGSKGTAHIKNLHPHMESSFVLRFCLAQ